MDNSPPPAHVLKVAKNLAARDIEATKILYQQEYLRSINSNFYDNMEDAIDVNFFEVNELLSLPAPPPIVTQTIVTQKISKNQIERDEL